MDVSASKDSVSGNSPNDSKVSSHSGEKEGTASKRGTKRKASHIMSSRDDRCMIVGLPEDVRPIILSFLAHKDRISLAATCGDLWKAVESFSKRKLDEFRTEHPSRDEEWETRINDQSSIDTFIPKPLELPFRYLLWKAFRTQLYSFGGAGSSSPLACPH